MGANMLDVITAVPLVGVGPNSALATVRLHVSRVVWVVGEWVVLLLRRERWLLRSVVELVDCLQHVLEKTGAGGETCV
jgi:hypothetical protein